jgi:putative flippase GtrA
VREGEIDHRSFRHWGGFIFSGLTAFLVDLAVAEALHWGLGVEANLANLIGILVATVVAWLLHRRISFNVQEPPSLREFLKFFLFASGANSMSFLSNALFLWLFPIIAFDAFVIAIVGWVADVLHLGRPSITNFEVAFFASRAVGGALSYIGFRFGVFRRPRLKPNAA